MAPVGRVWATVGSESGAPEGVGVGSRPKGGRNVEVPNVATYASASKVVVANNESGALVVGL